MNASSTWLRSKLAGSSPPAFVRRTTPRRYLESWAGQARHEQYPLWRLSANARAGWIVIGGRGAGKTRLGAEWVQGVARGLSPYALERYASLALVGETLTDVREVMIEGPSGIRTIAREDRPRFEPSRRRLVWDRSGAVAQIFSAEDPDSLRGPQFAAAWCDELAKWKNMDATFDMLQFGLRLGRLPLQLVTTTPRPAKLVRRLMADPSFELTRMTTRDNARNLAAGFLAAVEARYGGTVLGRQELEGEVIADRPDALWVRAQVEAALAPELARRPLSRIVVAVDPPAGSRRSSDACGIVAAGMVAPGVALVLADATVQGLTPQGWAARAVALYRELEADCLVAEVNQGGDMVAAVIRGVDATVPVRSVRASRGKWMRAEPVAALYEQGRVRHAARFPALEDEMCDFAADGLSSGRSPDRLDALVWAITELMLHGSEPRVRTL
ncbi:DNA-packaging protein [Aquibium microcysteis]|uniref:DNA-packaging protein n=1 Tax=Aquibium microcysteis TaxID=675281 RepID=UPI00165D2E22|nr:terminase family protein [Aquibium microcysteis]